MDVEVQSALVQGAATLSAAITVSIVGGLIARRYNNQRDRELREKEWVDQAIELTRLDVERKINTWTAEEKQRMRPPILDFLAYYRDLKQLDEKTPGVLYEEILQRRIKSRGNETSNAPE